MASRLALHCHRAGADVDAAIRACGWAAVKALSDPAPLATARDAGIPIRIFRLYGVEALSAPAAAAAFLAHDLSAATHVQLACESPRGLDPTWQGALIDGLLAGGYGGAFLVGGFATGNPSQVTTAADGHTHFPQVEPLYPLLRRPGVLLGLDAYTGTDLPGSAGWQQWETWTAERATLLHDCLGHHGVDARVGIEESGGDNVQPSTVGGGWLTRGWTAAQYIAALCALDADDQRHPWLLWRAIFTLGAPPDWAGYEIASIVPQLAAYVRQQAGIPPPKGPPVPDYAKATWAPSPNFWPGRQGHAPTAIVPHGTAGGGAVSWFQNPASQVSAHYVIDQAGAITQCVAEADSAWANGIIGAGGIYPAVPNPNLFTISIEHVRDTTNTSPLTAAQLAASLALVADILRRHPTITAIVPHDAIQPGRVCPGPGFPLAAFQALLTSPPPPPVPPTPSRAPKGHPGMPAPIFRLPQDPGSLDCWGECVRELFARYGYVLPLDAVFAAGKGKPRPVGGEAATFAEVERAIRTLAQQLGVAVQLLELDSPGAVMAALHDPDTANPWTVIAGVKEGDLQAGQNYGHFLILDSVDAAGNITVTDSYAETDGDPGHYPASQVQQAMVDNWEPLIDALGAKIKASA